MKQVVCLLGALLVSSPVLAWEIDTTDTKKTWSYAAFQAEKSGGAELQFYCDETYPEDIQLLVFTDHDAEPGDADFPSVSVDVVVDGTEFGSLSGYYDAVDDERTLVLDTLEEERVRDILTAARVAEQPIAISFDGSSLRFGVGEITPVLGEFIAGCER